MSNKYNLTTPIYNTLRNRVLFRKIISQLQRSKTISTGDRWRWKYHHYQTLSDILRIPAYHGMIFDKLKTNSLVITPECIIKLVKMPNIDFKIFLEIYQSKQWMFSNEHLLFHAAESGSMEKIMLLAKQEYPVRLARVKEPAVIGDEKINIVGQAFASLQFDLYEKLLYPSSPTTTITDYDEKLDDASPAFKAEVLMSSLPKLKDLSYLRRFAYGYKYGNNREKSLYQLKQEILKMDPNVRSRALQLLCRYDGLESMKSLFPKFTINNTSVVAEYFFTNYKDDYSLYDLYVMDYLGTSKNIYSIAEQAEAHVYKSLYGISNIKYQTYLKSESSTTSTAPTITAASPKLVKEEIEQHIISNPDFKMLVHLLTLLHCARLLVSGYYMRFNMLFPKLISDIIRYCGLINIGTHMILSSFGLVPEVVYYNVFKYGSMEQVLYTIEHAQQNNLSNDIHTWVVGGIHNQDPEIFNYLVKTFGLQSISNSFIEYDVADLTIDTHEKLKLCLSIDHDLTYSSTNYVQPKKLTKQYLMDLVEFMKRDPHQRKFEFDFNCLEDCDVGFGGDDDYQADPNIEIIRLLAKEFRYDSIPLFKAVIHSLHYRYIKVFIESDPSLISEITDIIGYLGDHTLFDIVIQYLSNKQLQMVINQACVSGSLSLLDHCKSKYPERTSWKKSTDIVKLGRIDIIQYYLDQCQQSKETLILMLLEKALAENQIGIFYFLIDHQLLPKEKRISILESTPNFIKAYALI